MFIEIATVSEYSKRHSYKYQIDSNKISVVYNGINNHFEPLDNDLKLNIKAQYANNCDYFLFIGTIHPRKNLKINFWRLICLRRQIAIPHINFNGNKVDMGQRIDEALL